MNSQQHEAWITKEFRFIAAPFTPMLPNGSIHPEKISEYYTSLVQNNISGAFINGSTGEGVSQSVTEKKKVAEAWAQVSEDNKGFKIINLVGGNNLPDCIELAKYSRDVGVDYISIIPPFYFKPANVEQLAKFIAEIGQAVPEIPVYYYHIPVLTGVGFNMIDLLPEMEKRLPNFAGIKYTHEDFMDYLSCMNYGGGKYDMLWGRDENLLAALSLGAPGTVGSTYNYAAPLYHRLYEAFTKNDLSEAQKLQQQSINMIRLLGKYGGIGTGKAFMKLINLDCGEFRLPVKNMDASTFAQFKKETEQIDFNSFCSTPSSKIS